MNKIINAKDRKVSNISNAMPNVAESIMEILQPVIATIMQKQQISGYTEEIPIDISTKASIQPLTAQQLKMLPEGQRAWKYSTVFCLSNIDLIPDDIFIIKGINYRILSKTNWKEYGFIEYSTIEDYNVT